MWTPGICVGKVWHFISYMKFMVSGENTTYKKNTILEKAQSPGKTVYQGDQRSAFTSDLKQTTLGWLTGSCSVCRCLPLSTSSSSPLWLFSPSWERKSAQCCSSENCCDNAEHCWSLGFWYRQSPWAMRVLENEEGSTKVTAHIKPQRIFLLHLKKCL